MLSLIIFALQVKLGIEYYFKAITNNLETAPLVGQFRVVYHDPQRACPSIFAKHRKFDNK